MERFNESTGQVYAEKMVSVRSMKSFSWVNRNYKPKPRLLRAKHRTTTGAPSLLQMVTRAFALHVDNFKQDEDTVEAVQAIPTHLIRSVIQVLKET
jgi:hypothetical protein